MSLTVLGLLKPHLKEDNHQELLAGVSGSSVRQAKEWPAARFPVPDAPSSIRKQPEHRPAGSRRPTRASEEHLLTTPPAPAAARAVDLPADHSLLTTRPAPAAARAVDLPADRRSLVPPPAPRARVEPLSRDRFLVKFTASRTMKDKLEQARDLMSHANPSGELAVVVERAVDLLIAELEKRTQGRALRPRAARTEKEPASADRTPLARVTRAARRDIVARDGFRCAFVANDGRRCNATTFLQIDHEIPRGRGGGSHIGNLRVLCQAHNRLAAERVYGKAHVARAISHSPDPEVPAAPRTSVPAHHGDAERRSDAE